VTDPSSYITPEQAAALTPFGNADWYREQMRLGKLWATKVGGRWFTTIEAIDTMAQAGSNSTRRRRKRAVRP
jgi:hypothetical protein